jgi:acyl carrier protein
MSQVISRDALRNRVIDLLHEVAGFSPDTITDTSTIDTDLQMQSVAFVELQVALEDEYQISLDPIRLVELNEFAAIVDYIHRTIEASA